MLVTASEMGTVRELCDEPWERTDAVSMVHEVKPRGLKSPSPKCLDLLSLACLSCGFDKDFIYKSIDLEPQELQLQMYGFKHRGLACQMVHF